METAITNIFEKIAAQKYINLANTSKRGRRELNRLSGLLPEERERIIDSEYPYLKTRQAYESHLLKEYFPKIQLKKYIAVIERKMFQLLTWGDSLEVFFEEFNINIEKKEKLLLKKYFADIIAQQLYIALTQELCENGSTPENGRLLWYINKLEMRVQSALTASINELITPAQNSESTRRLLSKRISDHETERTIPTASRKMQQTLDTLDAEKIVCFCCPDYPWSFIDWTLVWKYDMDWEVWDEIGFFGWRAFQILSEIGWELKQEYNKLKSIIIIMPSYQFYQSPQLREGDDIQQKYGEFVDKLKRTGEKLKRKAECYFAQKNISWIEITVALSSEYYWDNEIDELKSELKPKVAQTIESSSILKRDHKKLLVYEEKTWNLDPADELMGYVAEWLLLQRSFDNQKTLLVIPEPPQMPKLVAEIQEIRSSDEVIWLPMLIIQKNTRSEI